MNDFTFTKTAFREYVEWQTEDRKTLKKINDLLEDIRRSGLLQGKGKPERLKYGNGYSRRIDEYNRLVYTADELENIKEPLKSRFLLCLSALLIPMGSYFLALPFGEGGPRGRWVRSLRRFCYANITP